MAIQIFQQQNPYPQLMSELYRIAADRNQRKEELTARRLEGEANRAFQLERDNANAQLQIDLQKALYADNQAERERLRADARERHTQVITQLNNIAENERLDRIQRDNEFVRMYGTPETTRVIDDPGARGLQGPPQIEVIPGQTGFYERQREAEIDYQRSRDALDAAHKSNELELRRQLGGRELDIALERLRSDYDVALRQIKSGDYRAELSSQTTKDLANLGAATQLALSKAANETQRLAIRTTATTARKQIAAGERISMADMEGRFNLGKGELALHREDMRFRHGLMEDMTSPFDTPPQSPGLMEVPDKIRSTLNDRGFSVPQYMRVDDALRLAEGGPRREPYNTGFLRSINPVTIARDFAEARAFRGDPASEAQIDALNSLAALANQQRYIDERQAYNDRIGLEQTRRGYLTGYGQ
jgi:hypothetical protein